MSLFELLVGKKKDIKPDKAPNLKVLKIFLVDDNIAFSRLIENYIITKMSTFFPLHVIKVVRFETGKECIERLSENPDIILLDYYLSDDLEGSENGDKIFLQIKNKYPQIKVVMLSGLEETGLVKKLLSMGLFGFVIKDEDMFDHIKILVKEASKHNL